MLVRFFDRENESNVLNGSLLDSDDALTIVLDTLRDRSPFICELVGDNSYNLMIGVGGDSGCWCVQYSAADGDLPYWMALGSASEEHREDSEFALGGTATPVSVRYCLSSETARAVAVFFRQTGDRSPAVSWEEI